VGYLCANFSLHRPLCSRLRRNVRDRRQSSDAHYRLCLRLGVGGIVMHVYISGDADLHEELNKIRRGLNMNINFFLLPIKLFPLLNLLISTA